MEKYLAISFYAMLVCTVVSSACAVYFNHVLKVMGSKDMSRDCADLMKTLAQTHWIYRRSTTLTGVVAGMAFVFALGHYGHVNVYAQAAMFLILGYSLWTTVFKYWVMSPKDEVVEV